MNAVSPQITGRRELNLGSRGRWDVVEFDDGARYMLTCDSGSLHFSAHFDADQWAAFQKLVSP